MFEDDVAEGTLDIRLGKHRAAGNIHCVDDTRNPTKDGQTDVDEEISTASCLKEHSKRGEDEGKDKLANVTVK